jgi:restriction system protein
MAVPDFQSFFRPLLDIAVDGGEHSMKEARDIIAKRLNISESDLRELLPSGTQTKYDNRIAWAKSYFVQANVFESPRRGWFRITERGKELHKKGHDRIDVMILSQFPDFVGD